MHIVMNARCNSLRGTSERYGTSGTECTQYVDA